jgi:hypothetical protein
MWKYHIGLRTLSSISFLAGALIMSPLLASGEQALEWADLVDGRSQVFYDPYRELEPTQLERVITVARLRASAAAGESIDRNKLRDITASLVAEGIDIDDLIEQRWVVAKKRERAATAGNPALDDQEISIAGFVIPAPSEADGTRVAYLVPERGMCSHMPPPVPNQMIRLRLLSDWHPSSIYEPARITGRLSINPTRNKVQIVDGLIDMHATFEMDVKGVTSTNLQHIEHSH